MFKTASGFPWMLIALLAAAPAAAQSDADMIHDAEAITSAPIPSASGLPPAVPQAEPEPPALAPGLAWDPYFVPFMDHFWQRIHFPPTLAAPPELFVRFDPAVGLEKQAQTSRVARAGHRTEVFAPVMTVTEGQTFDVPIIIRGGKLLTGFRVLLVYDPDIVQPLEALGVGIPTEDIGFNAEPDPQELRTNADRTVVALNVLERPWKAEGAVLRIRFRAKAAGESSLKASLVDIANEVFEDVPAVFHSGLVKVKPAA